MERSFSEALKQRRTYYSIINQSPISDQEIECIVNMTMRHVPSIPNSQSTRVVLLLGESHKKLRQVVKDVLKRTVPAEVFVKTEGKIDHSFACGYGTVLFFEGQRVAKGLQKVFSAYRGNFPGWSLQTSAMYQLAIWVMFEDAGLGASLQYCNPLIDEEVRRARDLPEHWHLIAEMPFGPSLGKPDERKFQPLEERARIFK